MILKTDTKINDIYAKSYDIDGKDVFSKKLEIKNPRFLEPGENQKYLLYSIDKEIWKRLDLSNKSDLFIGKLCTVSFRINSFRGADKLIVSDIMVKK